jgi:hypothetical protein
MFYAASEIVFWILLSALIGGGIGYGLNEAKSVRLGKRLADSRADAPLERELATAWDTIEDLNRRLQVAHETIRNGEEHAEGEPVADGTDEDNGQGDAAGVPFDEAADPAPLVHTIEDAVTPAELGADEDATDGVVGARLSDRVASASIGNQIEVVKPVDLEL